MSFWNSLRISSSALQAQRIRLDTIANNIANAETTRTDEGGPYQRQEVVFQPEGESPAFATVLQSFRSRHLDIDRQVGGVEVAEIIADDDPGQLVYDPTHPDADEDGYVLYPNVNLVVEMTNMLSATRSYEANLAVVDAAKQMAVKALQIGRS